MAMDSTANLNNMNKACSGPAHEANDIVGPILQNMDNMDNNVAKRKGFVQATSHATPGDAQEDQVTLSSHDAARVTKDAAGISNQQPAGPAPWTQGNMSQGHVGHINTGTWPEVGHTSWYTGIQNGSPHVVGQPLQGQQQPMTMTPNTQWPSPWQFNPWMQMSFPWPGHMPVPNTAAMTTTGPVPSTSTGASTSTNQGKVHDISDSDESDHDELSDLVTASGPDHVEEDDHDEDFLDSLAQFYDLDDKCSPNVADKLAGIVNNAIQTNLNAEKLKAMIDKYPRPENCHDLRVPEVNSEIWSKLNRGTKSAELQMQKMQGIVLRAMVPLIQVMDDLLPHKDNKEHQQYLTKTADSFRLLTYAFAAVSQRRREMIRPQLNGPYRQLCNSKNKVTQYLFGDDLGKQIKDINEAQRVGTKVSHDRRQAQGQQWRQGQHPNKRFKSHNSSPRGRGKSFLRKKSSSYKKGEESQQSQQ